MSRPIEASWLAVRREADSAARADSAGLVEMLVRSLPVADAVAPEVLAVVDVGAGTGANQAWLGPALAAAGYQGVQDWHLVDHDAALLEAGAETTRTKAEHGDLLRTTRHQAGVESAAALLERQPRPRLLTCSALLDLLTTKEVDTLVRATLRSADAALWALSVTGEVALPPPHPADSLVSDLFNADQQRSVGPGRHLLGPRACAYADRALRAGGWRVHRADTRWRLGPAEEPLARRWVAERAEAAGGASTDPRSRARVRSWAEARRDHLDAGVLRVVVGHTDLLALPDRVISVHTSSPSW